MSKVSKLISFLLLIVFYSNSFASSLKLVGYINALSCQSCNAKAKNLANFPDLTKAITFVYSTKTANYNQSLKYTQQIIGQPVAIEMNNKVHAVLNKTFGASKVPVICLYDTLGDEVVFSSSIDSLLIYEDVFRKVLKLSKPFVVTKHPSKPIAKLIGWKNFSKVGDNLIVHSFKEADKLYVYNLKNHLTDSIMINAEAMELIYAQLKLPATYAAVNKYRKRFDGPGELLYKFSTEPSVNGDELMVQLDVFYYNPLDTGYIIKQEWFPFVFSYNVKTKTSKFFHVNTWNSYPGEGSPLPSYIQDLCMIELVNDTLLLLGCDKSVKDEMELAKTKLVLQYVKPQGTTTFEYKGVVADSLTIQSYTFSGKSLNMRAGYYGYRYHKEWLFYEGAPVFLDRKYQMQRDVRDYQRDITWIVDMHFTNNTITLLCKTDSVALLQIVVNRKTNEVLGKQVLVKEDDNEQDEEDELIYTFFEFFSSKNNYLLTEQGIYILNWQGEIIEMVQ
ncbi:MAG: hypothetical protein EAY81_09985 [Bacteroidetes bacterium]|nr:MAG: hypothetical protein EAY81_09985 [Bacteroidota bacterium]